MPLPAQILLYTDFGPGGPYIGQMHLALAKAGVPVIELASDAPMLRPRHAGVLLNALWSQVPEGALVVGVVDPGVGGDRDSLLARVDGRWVLGPDNGLFGAILRNASEVRCWRPSWEGAVASWSFHGRDRYAPAAVALVQGEAAVFGEAFGVGEALGVNVEPELAEVVYFDHYANAMTGIAAAPYQGRGLRLRCGGRDLPEYRTFCEVAEGEAFWYCNSIGLVEIAVNGGRAGDVLGLGIGTPAAFEIAPASHGGSLNKGVGA